MNHQVNTNTLVIKQQAPYHCNEVNKELSLILLVFLFNWPSSDLDEVLNLYNSEGRESEEIVTLNLTQDFIKCFHGFDFQSKCELVLTTIWGYQEWMKHVIVSSPHWHLIEPDVIAAIW